MNKLNLLALFCEDIREEGLGTVSLVGVLQDNISVPAENGMIPKLYTYAQISFESSEPIPPGKLHVHFPDGHKLQIGEIER